VALQEGYRLIDTAFSYNNEEAIGRALRRWVDAGKCCREELFITTKVKQSKGLYVIHSGDKKQGSFCQLHRITFCHGFLIIMIKMLRKFEQWGSKVVSTWLYMQFMINITEEAVVEVNMMDLNWSWYRLTSKEIGYWLNDWVSIPSRRFFSI
jgi:hypothetical protein